MRTLKYAILGLLYNKSMTGYDLMKEFGSALNEFWSAKHSQIYPELKKLTNEGMVEYKIEVSGTSLEKKCYYITEEGKADFLTWLQEEIKEEETPKSIFRLKLFYSAYLDPTTRKKMLEQQLRLEEARLEHLKLNQKKFSKIPEQNSPEFGDYLVLMGAIMREETNCEWLRNCLKLL